MKTKVQIKFIALAIFASAAAIFSSCDKVKFERTVNGGEITFTIDPRAAGDFDVSTRKKIDLAGLVKEFGLKASDISSMKVKVKAFYIIDSSLKFVTFDYLNKATFSIGEPGVQKTVAHVNPMPMGKGKGPCEADQDPDLEIISFANAETTEFHLAGTLNTPIDHPVQIQATVDYDLKMLKK